MRELAEVRENPGVAGLAAAQVKPSSYEETRERTTIMALIEGEE
jgi:hypothetical protein